jgi:hypothetical protein
MSKLPDANPTLTAFLVRQQRQMVRVAQTSAFARSGSAVTSEGVVTVAGAQQSADFDGDLAAGDAGTTGWALNAARAAFGALFLRPGSIENDSLTSPVNPQAIYASDQNFALATTDVAVTSVTITVPAGFTSAVVSIVGRVYATNPNAAYDYLIAVSKISGISAANLPLLVGASGGSGITVAPNSRVLTGLTPGGTFVVEVRAYVSFANWAANAQNTAELSGVILWFR